MAGDRTRSKRARQSPLAVVNVPAATPTGSTHSTSPSGKFTKGNPGNTGPNRGHRSFVRNDVRWHLRRHLEIPEDEIAPLEYCTGGRIARRMVRAALKAEDGIMVRQGKDLIEAAYGTKAVNEEQVVVLSPEQARAERERIAEERRRLLEGGK